MSEAQIEQRRSVSPIWILPLVAVVIGAWLVLQGWLSEGPRVTVSFATGEGLRAGQTKVKRLSVDLGSVESVYLSEEFDSVTAVLRLEPGTEALLRDDTQFWVVRPRLGADGVSGLSTLLSGPYIEISPGK